MKKRFSFVLCVVAVMLCVFSLCTAAATFEPDSDGLYTVELDMQPGSQYLLFVLKGYYDQTNYIEAFAAAKDSDILYFEQKASDVDGKLTFGPFVPYGYYDATLILGGSDFDEPYLAGHLSAEGVSNSASITLSGLEQAYVVKGVGSDDYVIELDIEVLDSFGYPSVTDEEVTISLENADDGVSVQDNVITISKMAKEQTFCVNITAGDASKTEYVSVSRQSPVHSYIEVYSDDTFAESVDKITVTGVADNYPTVTVFAKTFDQYGNEVEDTYSYTYAGESVEETFVPADGEAALTVQGSLVRKKVIINTVTIPDYKEYALELYELILSCKEKQAEEKHVSTDGKDVFPEETWTTAAAVTAFDAAIKTAETALEAYGSDGYSDSDYADEVTALTKALTSYNSSFAAGKRVDITSISLDTSEITATIRETVEIAATTEPSLLKTTDVLTWKSSDEAVATVTPGTAGKATVKAVASGTATITVTTRAGLTASVKVTVINKATQILLSPSSLTATYGGEKAVLTAKVSPKESTDIIEWTYDEEIMDLEFNEYVEGAYRVIEATVIPKANGKAKVQASAVYGGKLSPECTVTTVMPEWETAKTPKASSKSGPLYTGTAVSLTSDTENATIYYTLDGTTPSKTNGRLYKNPIAINQSLTLKAIAVCNGYYDSPVSTYEYEMVNTKVTVSSAIARAGGVAKVYVDVTGFENITWSGITLNFDPDVIEYYAHKIHGDLDLVVNADDTCVAVIHQNGTIPDGRILEVSFRVKADAPEGDYEFATTASIVTEGVEGMSEAAVSDGKIVVNNYLQGDANDDGKIGLADVLLIKQYAEGKESAIKKILLPAADVDGDGDVDNDDAILVSRYCVGWDVTFRDATDVYDYRIVSGYDVGMDENGAWRNFYALYDPFAGAKEIDFPSVSSFDNASEIAGTAVASGTIVKLEQDGTVGDGVVGEIDTDNLVWIKSASADELVVAPVYTVYECKTCASEYVENYSGSTYTDILGNEHDSNVIKITSSTKFSVMKKSKLDENFFIDASIASITLSDIISAEKNLLCYNDKSEDSSGNYKTTYADYVKAFVCANGKNEAEFVIVVANGNEDAAYNVPCANCQ